MYRESRVVVELTRVLFYYTPFSTNARGGGVDTCLALGGCGFGKVENRIQPLFGEMIPATQKLNGCDGINKQSSRSATQYINFLIARPLI